MPFTASALDIETIHGEMIEVDEADFARATALVEAVATASDSEAKLVVCPFCDIPMVQTHIEPGASDSDPVLIEFRCPKCNQPGLSFSN